MTSMATVATFSGGDASALRRAASSALEQRQLVVLRESNCDAFVGIDLACSNVA